MEDTQILSAQELDEIKELFILRGIHPIVEGLA